MIKKEKSTVMFCRACGSYSTWNSEGASKLSAKPGERCIFCKRGTYVDTGINSLDAFDEANKKSFEKYDMNIGDIPSEWRDEIYRELFFYGKFDSSYSEDSANRGRKMERATENLIRKNENAPVPKCPICGSTNLKKLSTFGKVAKVKMFGIFGAGDLGKTYQCSDCKVKF